jgi:RHS repeat-associated protein
VRINQYLWDGGELGGITGYNSLVFASGPAPDMVLFESATTLHALLGDHVNTVRDVINTSGTVENHLVYNSYGELKSQTGGGAYSPFHRFTGKPFDVAVGLQYNVNRWYDPATGRWMSEDPIGFGGGHANLNVYVGNSPANAVDSNGLGPVPGTEKMRAAWRARHLARMEEWAAEAQAEQEARRKEIYDQLVGWLEVKDQFELGLNQGVLKVVEGITDVGTDTVNEGLLGGYELIPESDWAKDFFVDEEEWAHDLSTGLGGNSAIILATIFLGGPGSNVRKPAIPTILRPSTIPVTHWGPPGMTGLRPGVDWVMTGGPTWRNYILSGVWQPGGHFAWPGNYVTMVVPTASLAAPPGWQIIKVILGQRIYLGL